VSIDTMYEGAGLVAEAEDVVPTAAGCRCCVAESFIQLLLGRRAVICRYVLSNEDAVPNAISDEMQGRFTTSCCAIQC
jgi:hypothetical protein